MRRFRKSCWSLSDKAGGILAKPELQQEDKGHLALLYFTETHTGVTVSQFKQEKRQPLLNNIKLPPGQSLKRALIIAGDYLYLTACQCTLQIQATLQGVTASWITEAGLIKEFNCPPAAVISQC